MIKFTRNELDRFNDRVKNILENKECRKLFRRYVKQHRKEMYKVYKLFRKAQKASESGKVQADDDMMELIEQIDDLVDDENVSLHTLMENCCGILDRTVKDAFVNYLEQYHRS